MNAPTARDIANLAVQANRHHRHLSWRIRDAILLRQPHVYFATTWIPIRKCHRVLYWMLRLTTA